MTHDALLEPVVALCERAGEAIMQVYNRKAGFDVEHKEDASPVTEADLAAHAVLASGLEPLLEGVPVLSEESHVPGFEERRQWQRYWIIDPLDGTKEFINRNDEFTVNVALIENGEPVLGVVHVPALDITYTGVKGVGAQKRMGGETITIEVRTLSSRLEQGLPLEIVASRRHGADAVENLMQCMQARFGEVNTKNMGSSLKLCLVAEGEADLYPRLAPTCEWDTAAAQAIVEAAGGTVFNDDFSLMRYNTKENLLNPYFYVVGDTAFDWRGLLTKTP